MIVLKLAKLLLLERVLALGHAWRLSFDYFTQNLVKTKILIQWVKDYELLYLIFLLHDLPSTIMHISDDKHGDRHLKRHLCPHTRIEKLNEWPRFNYWCCNLHIFYKILSSQYYSFIFFYIALKAHFFKDDKITKSFFFPFSILVN